MADAYLFQSQKARENELINLCGSITTASDSTVSASSIKFASQTLPARTAAGTYKITLDQPFVSLLDFHATLSLATPVSYSINILPSGTNVSASPATITFQIVDATSTLLDVGAGSISCKIELSNSSVVV